MAQGDAASDSVLNDLSTALDLIVLEALPSGSFRRIEYSHVPEWFFARLQDEGGNPVSLQQAFPFLDAFLRDARVLWGGSTDGRRDSEPFLVTDSAGADVPVVATALAIRGRHYLLIQHDPAYEGRRKVLQTARERALEHERALRQVDALRKPLAALIRAVDDSGTVSDSSVVSAIVRQHVGVLRNLLGQLPPTARGGAPPKTG